MMASEMIDVPARAGKAVRLSTGWSVKLVNTVGSQVVDTWAFNAQDLAEHMSMEHTRVMLGRVNPRKGDQLYSNRRRPLLRMTEDTSPGVHDTLRAALEDLGLKAPHSPGPLNMFENCPVGEAGALVVVPPPVKAGDYVVLTAEVDTVVVFSACPMDVFPTNGPDRTPKPVAFQVQRSA